ncbi:MAG: NADH-quinone oxidoreductase subunit N [Verrucomicrobiales bacterium]|nr:NADH-quinone oxidoreductase subunit N [Verrucomicrobiales bacterium]
MSVFTIEAGLALLGLFLLLLDAFAPGVSRRTLGILSMAGVGLALVLLVTVAGGEEALPAFVKPFQQLDALAMFYKGFALVITLLVLWLVLECAPYMTRFTLEGRVGEMLSLPLFVCVGMMWMAGAKDLVTVFVALELVTVSFYVLVGYTRKSAMALEAGVKYLILGAISTGVLVFGIAWVYGATGSLEFEGIRQAAAAEGTNRTILLFGAAFLLAGLGFKVAAAPFQMWVPDVYQGASMPVAAFLSVGSKAAGFAVLSRVVAALAGEGSAVRGEVLAALIAAGSVTVLVGSLPAIFQTSVKRLLGYSSISHAGFLLLALGCQGAGRFGLDANGVVAFYLATYLPMTVLGFLALAVLRRNGRGEELEDFRGLGRRSPMLALVVTLAFASLAGLPLTVGFLGKMLVVLTLVDQGQWVALAFAILAAAVGFYYYFRVILAMYSSDEGVPEAAPVRVSLAARVVGVGLAVAVVLLGVYPRPLQPMLREASQAENSAVSAPSGH